MTVQLSTPQQVMKRWKMHRNSLLELVEVLPESSGSWRPWDGGMTTIELVYHLAWTPDFFFAAIEGREMKVPPVPATLNEARELLFRLTQEQEQILASYTESDLQRNATIDYFKVTEPVVDVLHRIIGHEAHHKGQLLLYARMLGVNTPFYVDLSV
ncbi:MAG TPA: DinB family protein [Paenibacillaceae bacterium]|nr:DinB family protein [Paenibacillaceae bacterium]